jgi:hypothetical protein
MGLLSLASDSRLTSSTTESVQDKVNYVNNILYLHNTDALILALGPANPCYGKAVYSLRICFTRAIASSAACSGVRPSVTMWWIAFGQTPSASTSWCRHSPEAAA